MLQRVSRIELSRGRAVPKTRRESAVHVSNASGVRRAADGQRWPLRRAQEVLQQLAPTSRTRESGSGEQHNKATERSDGNRDESGNSDGLQIGRSALARRHTGTRFTYKLIIHVHYSHTHTEYSNVSLHCTVHTRTRTRT